MRRAKTYWGNTWDFTLTEIVMGAVAGYMAPYLSSRAHEPDDGSRAGLQLLHVAAYNRLPVRRAWRTWAEFAMTEGTLEWRSVRAMRGDVPAIRRHPTAKVLPDTLVEEDQADGDDLTVLPFPRVRVPPVSKMPSEPVGPTDAERQAFKQQLRWWHECYTEDGLRHRMGCIRAISDAIYTGDPTFVPGAKHAEWRFSQQHLVPEARGRLIRVDAQGQVELAVPLREARRPHVRLRFDRLKKWLVEHQWHDKRTIWLCDWGESDDTEDRPIIGSFSPNSKNCYDDAAKTEAAIQKEVDAGWLYEHDTSARTGYEPFLQRSWLQQHDCEVLLDRGHTGLLFPEWLMEHVAPFNTRPKPNGDVRLMGNPAWPVDGQDLEECDGARVAPNAYRDLCKLATLVWASCESFGEGFAIVVAMADHCGLQARGACDDMRKWFRQIPLMTEAQHRAIFYWRDRRLTDRMSQMGRFSAAHHGQEVSFAVAEYVFTQVHRACMEYLENTDCPKHQRLRELILRRPEPTLALDDPECTHYIVHKSPFFMEDMQDDLGWVAASPELARVAWDVIASSLEYMGVELAQDKRDAYGEPQPMMTFMGGGFDGRAGAKMFIAEAKKEKWLHVRATWDGVQPGQLKPELMLLQTLGLAVFMCKFIVRGRRLLNRGFHCLAARAGRFKPISHGFLTDLDTFTRIVMQSEGVPPVVPSHWWWPGELGCNSDASRSDTEGGWGFNVLNYWARGKFSASQLKLLDISTLELIAVAFMCVCIGLHFPGKRRVVIRCDNEAACHVINNHGAASPPMEAALRLLEAVQQAFGLDVRAVHIAGARNVIADAFSRPGEYDLKATLARLRARTQAEPTRFEISEEWENGEAMGEILAVARRWRRTANRKRRRRTPSARQVQGVRQIL